MKSYTDIEQSKVLAKILPLESADYFWTVDVNIVVTTPYVTNVNGEKYVPAVDNTIPCWSLAALLDIYPYYEINNNGVNIQLSVKGEALITEKGECLLDLAVNMIIHLHELNLL